MLNIILRDCTLWLVGCLMYVPYRHFTHMKMLRTVGEVSQMWTCAQGRNSEISLNIPTPVATRYLRGFSRTRYSHLLRD